MTTTVQAMPRKKRNDIAVKIDAEIVRRARTISSHADTSLAEYLSEILQPIIEERWAEFKKRLSSEDKPRPRRQD